MNSHRIASQRCAPRRVAPPCLASLCNAPRLVAAPCNATYRASLQSYATLRIVTHRYAAQHDALQLDATDTSWGDAMNLLTPAPINGVFGLERLTFIGGSDAGAIVAGGDELVQLWRIKTGREERADLSDILPVQLGIYTERFNLDWYERTTGRDVTRRGEFVRHPTIPYLAANLDGVTTTSGGQLAYIDAKHVGRAGDQLTLRYTAQGTHCAIVLGYDWWCLSTLIGNSRWELTEQEVDPFFAAEYLEKSAEFWRYVERDEEPPPAPALPVPPPRKLRIVQLEDEFKADWPNWGHNMVGLLGSWAGTLRYHQAHEIDLRIDHTR